MDSYWSEPGLKVMPSVMGASFWWLHGFHRLTCQRGTKIVGVVHLHVAESGIGTEAFAEEDVPVPLQARRVAPPMTGQPFRQLHHRHPLGLEQSGFQQYQAERPGGLQFHLAHRNQVQTGQRAGSVLLVEEFQNLSDLLGPGSQIVREVLPYVEADRDRTLIEGLTEKLGDHHGDLGQGKVTRPIEDFGDALGSDRLQAAGRYSRESEGNPDRHPGRCRVQGKQVLREPAAFGQKQGSVGGDHGLLGTSDIQEGEFIAFQIPLDPEAERHLGPRIEGLGTLNPHILLAQVVESGRVSVPVLVRSLQNAELVVEIEGNAEDVLQDLEGDPGRPLQETLLGIHLYLDLVMAHIQQTGAGGNRLRPGQSIPQNQKKKRSQHFHGITPADNGGPASRLHDTRSAGPDGRRPVPISS